MTEETKEIWSQNLGTETQFWDSVVRGESKFSERLRDRAAGNWPFPQRLVQYCDPGRVTRILDVGAGPVSVLGTQGAPGPIEVVAIDPLADAYNERLDESGIVPLVRTRLGEAEHLTEYGLGKFDIVYSRNALDHSYDPLAAIESMLAMTVPTGVVFFEGNVNEGNRRNYKGLHQWNFEPTDNGDLVIWRADQRHSVRIRLGGRATVQAVGSTWYNVEIRHIT